MAGQNYEPEVVVEDITKLTQEEWRQYRFQGIGGSDAAALWGVSPWKTARDLYEEKVHGKSQGSDEEGWVAKEIGKRLEELVAQIFMKRTGLAPYAVRKMFRHPDYPFMLANVDYFVRINGKIYIIECKTSFSFHMEEWEDGGIPRHYELQGRHYMAVANVEGVIFLCLHGNSEDSFIMRVLNRDLDQEEELIRQESWFWESCVLKRNPPEYTEAPGLVVKSIQNRLGIQEGHKVELPGDLLEHVTAYLELKRRKSELDRQSREIETQMKSARAPVQEALKGAEKGILAVGNARYQAGYTKRVTTSINKEGLEAMALLHPDIFEEYARTRESRIFYIREEQGGIL